jgi:hypothetical protein
MVWEGLPTWMASFKKVLMPFGLESLEQIEMGKVAQKAQIIGNINMTEINMLMETLKVSPMQIGFTK